MSRFCDAISAITGILAPINKKLSYRRETARRVMLVNSCYFSLAMGVTKVSNRKSDFRGYSMALAMLPFDRPHIFSRFGIVPACDNGRTDGQTHDDSLA